MPESEFPGHVVLEQYQAQVGGGVVTWKGGWWCGDVEGWFGGCMVLHFLEFEK